jgi:hypothetical protein
MDQRQNEISNEIIETPVITVTEMIWAAEQNECESGKEVWNNLKCSIFEELRKLHSDSSAISDYSSENSETVADSDVSSRKNLSKLRLVRMTKLIITNYNYTL